MKLPTSLTLGNARDAAGELRRALEGCHPGQALQVDASALAELDSAALAVLLEGSRHARSRGLQLQLVAPPEKLRQLALLYGVEGVLGIPAGGIEE